MQKQSDAAYGYVNAFDTDGFSVGADVSGGLM